MLLLTVFVLPGEIGEAILDDAPRRTDHDIRAGQRRAATR
jgi:hypothetical protein